MSAEYAATTACCSFSDSKLKFKEEASITTAAPPSLYKTISPTISEIGMWSRVVVVSGLSGVPMYGILDIKSFTFCFPFSIFTELTLVLGSFVFIFAPF